MDLLLNVRLKRAYLFLPLGSLRKHKIWQMGDLRARLGQADQNQHTSGMSDWDSILKIHVFAVGQRKKVTATAVTFFRCPIVIYRWLGARLWSLQNFSNDVTTFSGWVIYIICSQTWPIMRMLLLSLSSSQMIHPQNYAYGLHYVLPIDFIPMLQHYFTGTRKRLWLIRIWNYVHQRFGNPLVSFLFWVSPSYWNNATCIKVTTICSTACSG